MRLAPNRPYASLRPRFEIARGALDVGNSAHSLLGRSAVRPIAAPRPSGIVVITRMPLVSGWNVLNRGATVPRRCGPKGRREQRRPEAVVQCAAVTGSSSIAIPRRVAICGANRGGVCGCDQQPPGKAQLDPQVLAKPPTDLDIDAWCHPGADEPDGSQRIVAGELRLAPEGDRRKVPPPDIEQPLELTQPCRRRSHFRRSSEVRGVWLALTRAGTSRCGAPNCIPPSRRSGAGQATPDAEDIAAETRSASGPPGASLPVATTRSGRSLASKPIPV
jgi:hypothetical protein